VFRTKVKERDKVVLSNAAVELYAEIPKAKAKAAKAAAPQAVTMPISADIFTAMGDYLAKNADAVKKIGVVYQFKLASPDSTWTVDTKTATVSTGGATPAQCTLELADADFMAMCTGKADAMKLFMDKKLRITGNVMASQKLEFLKKIDKNAAAAAVAAKKAQGVTQQAASTPKATSSNAPKIFEALGKRLADNPKLASEIGAVVQFSVGGKTFIADFGQKPVVKEGSDPKAAAIVTLTDEDLTALVKGQGVQSLYQHGQLRVDGDVRIAHKLGILKDLI
jgi:3-hydroxyacyl-CoA dehydrogenase/3a,7a,12a-trihydroxy-5b-cholest-24-enoyl-CoA hydratase